jgi:hypothetical protein
MVSYNCALDMTLPFRPVTTVVPHRAGGLGSVSLFGCRLSAISPHRSVHRPVSRILAEPGCWEAVMSADAERTGVRYQDVLDSLRVSYDSRAAWRDQQEKQPWKLAEREL